MFDRSTANERPSDCVPAINTQPESILFRTGLVITIPIVPLHFGQWRINCLVGVALGRFIDHPKPR